MYVHYFALSVYIQSEETEVWGGSLQAATQEWDVNDNESAVTIPESPVQIGDMKPVEVVFLASPEEFCVQVRMALVNMLCDQSVSGLTETWYNSLSDKLFCLEDVKKNQLSNISEL
jgi:hypothetical protein